MNRHLTFALAEVSAAGAFVALAILSTHLIWLVGSKHFPSEQVYRMAIPYVELPIVFLCAFFGGLIVRSKPVVFGIVLVLITHFLDSLTAPGLTGQSHFWIGMGLSFAIASAGAALATSFMSRLGKCEPVHPGWAGLAGFAVIAVTWTLAYFLTRSL